MSNFPQTRDNDIPSRTRRTLFLTETRNERDGRESVQSITQERIKSRLASGYAVGNTDRRSATSSPFATGDRNSKVAEGGKARIERGGDARPKSMNGLHKYASNGASSGGISVGMPLPLQQD